jgi:hypothetical protein
VAYRPPAPGSTIFSAGSPTGARLDVRSVVGPASYATGGIPVDLSATYGSIANVTPSRAFVTATKAAGALPVMRVNETGTDLFSAAKFRLLLANATPSHAHNVTAAGTNSAPTISISGGIVGTVPIGIDSDADAAAISKTTATSRTGITGVQAPVFTGSTVASNTAVTRDQTEISAANNESANTFEFIVIGVPL